MWLCCEYCHFHTGRPESSRCSAHFDVSKHTCKHDATCMPWRAAGFQGVWRAVPLYLCILQWSVHDFQQHPNTSTAFSPILHTCCLRTTRSHSIFLVQIYSIILVCLGLFVMAKHAQVQQSVQYTKSNSKYLTCIESQVIRLESTFGWMPEAVHLFSGGLQGYGMNAVEAGARSKCYWRL